MVRTTLSAIVGFALGARGLDASPGFERWAAEHGRAYAGEEEFKRAVANFVQSELILKELQSDPDDGAEYGHTMFSDRSPSEFKISRFPGHMDPSIGTRGGDVVDDITDVGTIPDSVDWRAQGAVTPVKDQSSCGSCWAESAVGNIESMWYLANKGSMKAPVALSVQEVIECDAHDNACYGGFPKGAYEYVIERGGITSESDYPYGIDGKTICLANQTFNETCGDGLCDDPPLTNSCDQTCSDKAAKHQPVAHIASWQSFASGEDAMAAFAATRGPISIGIDASGGGVGILFPWLQFYHSGVANPKRCTNTIDHGVLIVGYGVEGSTKYWIVKNSWGTKWGESGYFRLIRGASKCGIHLMATSSVISKTGPALLGAPGVEIVVV